MQDIKKLQQKFNKLGCLTEIDGKTLWITEDGGIGNFDIQYELDKLEQPKWKYGRYDTCGMTQFAVEKRFLNRWF